MPRGSKLISPLVIAAFFFLVVFNLLSAPAALNSNVAISTVYDGVTTEDDVHPVKQLRVATILTEPRKYHCTMLASAAFNNVSVDVVGWGDKRLHGTTGWWRKILWFKELLKGYGENDVAVFVDAGDVLFNGGEAEIVKAYQHIVGQQHLRRPDEFFWSAERNCGMKTLTREQCNTLHNVPAESSYRYLNTGGWAGRVDAAKYIFDAVDSDRAGKTDQADQAFVAASHVSRNWKTRHGLDYSQYLFMSVYKAQSHICGWPDVTLPLSNCNTHTTPPIFHFNAGSKDPAIFDKVLAKTWWYARLQSPAGKQFLDNHVIRVNGKDALLGRLCPTGYGLVADGDVKQVRSRIDLGAAEQHPELP